MKTLSLAVLAVAALGVATPAFAYGCSSSKQQTTEAEKPKAPVENPST